MVLKKYVKDKYLDRITEEIDGKKIIKETAIHKLNLTPNEQKLIKLLIDENKIELVEDMIKSEDRDPTVGKYNYEIPEELKELDKPKIADIRYENNMKVYEDYSKLEEYIEKCFIPTYILMKQKKNSITNQIEYFSYIRLVDILELRLNHDELEYLFYSFSQKGIMVVGTSPTIDYNITNYIYVKTYKYNKLPKYINDAEKEREMFEKLRRTKDLTLRNQIIVDNLRLAKYIASKFYNEERLDISELESYASEGLVKAVDGFDTKAGTRFSTYAYPMIIGYVKRGIIKEEKIYTTESRIDLLEKIKPYINTVEAIHNITLRENPNLVNNVVDLMLEERKITQSQKDNIKKFILRTVPVSLETDNIHIVDSGGLDSIFDIELKERIKEALSSLKPIEEKVLVLRFGINGDEGKTLEEIGKIFDVTRERIRKIEVSALRRIRESSHNLRLRDFYNETTNFYNYGHSIFYKDNDLEETEYKFTEEALNLDYKKVYK